MNLWKIFLLTACFIAIANCKPERLEDVAKDEKLIESDEKEDVAKDEKLIESDEEEDVMLSNDKEEADTEDEPKSEALDEKKEDELSEDVVEKEFEEDEPAEESEKNKDELIQKADAPTPNEEKKEDEIVKNEEEDEKERKPENDEKKRDEKLTHNDPQVGYTLRKNFIHDAFETWSPAYSITFQIKPLYIVNHWTSILHFTTGGNLGAHGRRVPAVFIMPHTSILHICTSLHNSNNWCVNSAALPLHKYSYVTISQYPSNIPTKYMYRVYVNGKLLANVENKTPRYFQNIKVYK
uniref:Cnidarian restricted protein n=2 Tax=Clytia hemisphaerica TaxID=252671 RepID=A0A7M5UIV1_9CNID